MRHFESFFIAWHMILCKNLTHIYIVVGVLWLIRKTATMLTYAVMMCFPTHFQQFLFCNSISSLHFFVIITLQYSM